MARWRAAYGQDSAARIAAVIAQEPLSDVTPRDPADAAALAQALNAQVLPGGSLRAGLKGDLAEWPGFAEGLWWVQDASAAVPARLLHVTAGQSALDLCAAPGGKTLQLAATGADVTAVDRSGPRQVRTAQNLERMGLKAELVAADAASWADARLSTPCCWTRPARRPAPSAASRTCCGAPGRAEIAKLAEVQARLLDAAAGG